MRTAALCMLVICALLSVAAGSALAAEKPELRTITVSGDADVKVVPDEVTLTLGVESFEKSIAAAKSVNDGRVKKVIAVARDLGIEQKHVQTDHLTIEPRYKDGSYSRTWGEKRELQGYRVQKTVAVTLKDIAKFEELLGGVLDAGADHVHGISFKTTELRRHRDAARAMAIKAAREKAVALAGELGQRVGKPQEIREEHSGWNTWGGSWGGRGNAMAQNAMQSVGGEGAGTDGSLAPGQIAVNARVSVMFALE